MKAFEMEIKSSDTLFGAFIGIFVGFFRLLFDYSNSSAIILDSFSIALLKVGLTAAVGGIMGAIGTIIGKLLCKVARDRYQNFNSKRFTKK